MSIFDAIATDYGLKAGLIEEANVLMRSIHEFNVTLFYLVKISLPVFLLILIPKLKSTLVAKIFMIIALIAYASVIVIHLIWISIVLMN